MKIHHIALTVEDLQQSENFYKDVLGFVEVKRFERKDLRGRAVFLESEGIKLEIWEFSEKPSIKNKLSNLKIVGLKHIAFVVSDISKIYQELKTKGLEISEPQLGASGAYFCFLKDPDGILIEFYEI